MATTVSGIRLTPQQGLYFRHPSRYKGRFYVTTIAGGGLVGLKKALMDPDYLLERWFKEFLPTRPDELDGFLIRKAFLSLLRAYHTQWVWRNGIFLPPEKDEFERGFFYVWKKAGEPLCSASAASLFSLCGLSYPHHRPYSLN